VNLFIDKNAEITVILYVYKNEENKIISWTKNNTKNKPENINENDCESFSVVFRVPNYKDSTELIDSGIQLSSDGSMRISSGSASFGKFSKLLKSWDLKDEKGENIPAIPENVAILEPSIGKSIIADLENQLS